MSGGEWSLHAEGSALRKKTDPSGGKIMRENKAGAIVIKSFALLVVLGMAHHAMAQEATTLYPKMDTCTSVTLFA